MGRGSELDRKIVAPWSQVGEGVGTRGVAFLTASVNCDDEFLVEKSTDFE